MKNLKNQVVIVTGGAAGIDEPSRRFWQKEVQAL